MLDPEIHERLIQDKENICAVAGVQPKYLDGEMKDICGPKEVEWVKTYHRHKREGCAGLLLLGTAKPDTKCQAMAAAFLRNFIDARVIPLNTLLALCESKQAPQPSVLLIPNLFLNATNDSLNVAAWRIQQIYDLLLERSIHQKLTVAYVESLDGLTKVYGKTFADFLKENFVKVA